MATLNAQIKTTVVSTANTTTVSNFINGSSVFYDGVTFTLKGSGNVQIIRDGETAPAADARMHPVFLTSIADDAYLWLSSFVRPKLDIKGKAVEKDGSFDKLVKDELAKDPNRSVDDALAAIVAAVNGRTIRVRRKPYEGFDKNGDKRVLSIVCLDLV